MKSFLIAAATLVATLAATPSYAAMPDQSPQIRVEYADLDLTNPVGARAMFHRLMRASRHMCGAHGGRMGLEEWSARRTCARETLQVAVQALDAPMVTMLAETRYGPLRTQMASLPEKP